MALTCFANGSLARERVRDAHGLDWDGFSAALRSTPAGNGGAMMTPWFVPEITPLVAAPDIRRHDLDDADGARMVRAIVEAQAMAMRLHSRWIAPRPATIRATGGAAANREILQVIADVFDAEVVRERAAERRLARRRATRLSRRPPRRGRVARVGGGRRGIHRARPARPAGPGRSRGLRSNAA